MKTLALTIMTAIMALAMVTYAGNTQKPGHANVIKITLQKAMEEPGLVAAMHKQIDISLLKPDQKGLYTAYCVYNKNVYKIYGTREAWVKFFLNKKIVWTTGGNNFHQ